MAYEMTVWQDGDLITAERLNKLEQGVANEQTGPQGEKGADGAPGKDGQTPRIGENGHWWIGEQDTGISATGPKGEPGSMASFNGRTGAIVPESGDYTAEMVGAIPTGNVAKIQLLTSEQYEELTSKDAKTLYLIQE